MLKSIFFTTMKRFKVILSIIITVAFIDGSDAQITKCLKKDLARIDTLGALATGVGKYGRHLPETKAELVSFCRESKVSLNEVESLFKTCYEGQTKQFMSIVVFSLRKTFKNFCSKKTEKRTNELLDMGKCGNVLNVTLTKCVESYIDNLQGTLAAKPEKRFTHICW